MISHPPTEFSRNSLFRGIAPDQLEAAGIVASDVTFDTGEIIFEEGDTPDYCYLVGSGAVRISKALPTGDEELLATIRPGDFFGELALYDSSPRSARATAAVSTQLGRLDAEVFERLRRLAPLQIASTLADRTIERVRETNAHMVAELSAAGRLSKMGTELGTLAHNLRSPLATIRNAADLLHDWLVEGSANGNDNVRFVELIRGTADRALTQIDQLMARLRGEVEEDRLYIPVEMLLRELHDLVSGHVQRPGIVYRDQNLSYRGEVLVNRAELVAALGNLVKNAVEALPADGGEIVVSVTAEDESVVFSVSDNGAGIRAEYLPLLFERSFSQGKEGGTGLGLSHVRTVAERHGGKVHVESEVGRGTTVRVRLPNAL